jgi:hypothetical protein
VDWVDARFTATGGRCKPAFALHLVVAQSTDFGKRMPFTRA